MSVSSSVKSHGWRRLGVGVGLAVWVVIAFVAGELLTVGIAQAVNSVYPLATIKPVVLNTVLDAVAYALALAVTIVVPWRLMKRSKITRKELGVQRFPDWPDLLLGPVATIPYFILSSLFAVIAMQVIPGFNLDQAQGTGYSNLTERSALLLAFIMLVVIAPVVEETLFRGYLYGKIRKHLGLIVSALLTSVAFAMLHIPGVSDSGALQWQWNVAVDVFALSLVLCLLREVTGSIWAGVLLHMTKNTIAFYVLFIMPIMLH